ncbi:MAG: DUF3488 domain-containing protein, partial [Propionibacteriaceae bacterium]|nr:DUF3488 domain-containing protein [Propionibacteriaceae bacterium]
MMRVWAGLLSALAVILTFWGITSLMAAGLWQWHLVAFPLLVLIVMSLPTIAAKRFPLAAPITAAVGGVLVWIGYVGYLVPGASLLPTPNSLRVIGNHLQTAMLEIIEAYRPAQATDLILPLALVGLGPVCLLVIFLAVVARRPIWAGLPLIGCWAVFLVGDPASGLGSALSAGVAYLLLIGLTERGFRRRRPREVAMTPVVALATVVGLFIALVGPALPGWGDAYDWPGKLPFNKSAIDPEKPISVEDFFQVPSNEKILRVKGEVTGPLKVASYRNFDGREWVPGNDYFTEAYYESGRWVQDGEVWAKPPDAETTVIAVYLGQEDALGPVISYEIEPMPPNVVYPGDRNGPIFPNRWDAWDLLTVLYPHSRGEYELPRGLDIQFDPETGVIAIGPSPDVLGGGGSGRYALYNREGGGLFASGLIGGWGYDYGYREYTVPQVPPLEHWSAADPFVVEMIQANGRGLPTAIGPRALTMEDAPPPRYNYEMDAFLYSRTLMEAATYRVYPMNLDRSRLGEYEGVDLEEISSWLSGQISGENRTFVVFDSDLD